jgi:hypothetical protein
VGDYFASMGVLERIRYLSSAQANLVVVCPEAASAPFGYWMAPPRESLAELSRQALEVAANLVGQTITIQQRVVSAHSGGGLALRNAVSSGQMAADALEFLDCNYGNWGAVIADWAGTMGRSMPKAALIYRGCQGCAIEPCAEHLIPVPPLVQ